MLYCTTSYPSLKTILIEASFVLNEKKTKKKKFEISTKKMEIKKIKLLHNMSACFTLMM